MTDPSEPSLSNQSSSMNSYYPVDRPPMGGYSQAGETVSKALPSEKLGLCRWLRYMPVTVGYRVAKYLRKTGRRPYLFPAPLIGFGAAVGYLLIVGFNNMQLPVQIPLPFGGSFIHSQIGHGISTFSVDGVQRLEPAFIAFFGVLETFILFTVLSPVALYSIREPIERKLSNPYRRVSDRQVTLLTASPSANCTPGSRSHQPQERLLGYTVGRGVSEDDVNLADKCMDPNDKVDPNSTDDPVDFWRSFGISTGRDSFEPKYAILCIIENSYYQQVFESTDNSASYLEESQTLPRNEVVAALPRTEFPWVHWTTISGVTSLQRKSEEETADSDEPLVSIETGILAFAEDETQLKDIKEYLDGIESAYNGVKCVKGKTRLYYGPIDPEIDGSGSDHRLKAGVLGPFRRLKSGRRSAEWMQTSIERVKAGKPVKRSRLALLRPRTARPILSRSDQLHIFSVMSGQDAKTANRVGRKRRDQTVIDDVSPEQEDQYTTDLGGEDDE